ncbi:xanthine dehydrogenase accessory factor [Ensifer mexicanus]|nr:xanthine dehydrogenase accessory factor [Sinorhizobium mexicanum]
MEAAVASEALLAMSAGKDQIVKFGAGSRFFDIVLPCGGGITIAIHVLKDVSVILQTLELLNKRLSAALRYSPCGQILDLVPSGGRPRWIGGDFVTVYHPRPRILVCGETVEAMAVASIGKAAGYDVVRTGQGRKEMSASIDEFTAVVLLRHDLEAEQATLNEALRSSAFYIGALGSTRTHEKRVQRLQANGWSSTDIDRIKAPIGVFGPTRDASSLALSVMADVAASRLAASYEDRR